MLKKVSVHRALKSFEEQKRRSILAGSLKKPARRRTGALPELGLMTTLGATPCPDLVGVPGAPEAP